MDIETQKLLESVTADDDLKKADKKMAKTEFMTKS